MTTANTNQTVDANINFERNYDLKLNAAISEQSNSTACVTLGKRDPAQHAFIEPQTKKRAKNFDSSSQHTEEPLDHEINHIKNDIPERLVKTAPTSANGSNNPNPVLDIQVNLPVDESEINSNEDSCSRKERRYVSFIKVLVYDSN